MIKIKGIFSLYIETTILMFFLLLFIFLIPINISANQSILNITEQDKAEILKISLFRALSEVTKAGHRIDLPDQMQYNPCLANQEKRMELIVLKNINEELLPKSDCIEFRVLSSKDSFKKFSKKGVITYIKIEEFTFEDNKAYITISDCFSEKKFFESFGYRYEFIKQNDKWISKKILIITSIT
jgi:hypothetical protein